MIFWTLALVGTIELIAHFLGYNTCVAVGLVRTAVTKVAELVQSVLPKGK